MKGFVRGADRQQTTLLPECLDIGWTRAILFERWMCSSMRWNWANWGSMRHPGSDRPAGISSSAMLKLYIYGYLNRVQSSRRLEREAGRNLEVMWLTGRLFRITRPSLIPQRQRPAIKKVCAQSLRCAARWVCWRKRALRSTAASSRRLTRVTTTHEGKDGAAPGADRGERCALSEPA